MRVFLVVIVMAEWLFVLVFGFQQIFCLIGKPGTCPRSMGKLPSTFCTCDNECPGKMKCCAFNFSYCGLSSVKGKPVPCRLITAADRVCTADEDCPNGWKCYSNGCGRLCAPPATGK